VRTLHKLINLMRLEGIRLRQGVRSWRAVPALDKMKNFGGAGLRARQNNGGQRRPPHQNMAAEETFGNRSPEEFQEAETTTLYRNALIRSIFVGAQFIGARKAGVMNHAPTIVVF